MNVERIFYWIRLVAWVILEIFPGGDNPGEDEEGLWNPDPTPGTPGRRTPGMKPERIQLWLRVLARSALQAVEGFGEPPVIGRAFRPQMKPERIQFWLQLIARFVLAVLDAAIGETGKSGERSVGPAPTGAPASEEADN